MARPVIYGGKRRRRSPILPLGAVLACAGIAVAAWQLVPGGDAARELARNAATPVREAGGTRATAPKPRDPRPAVRVSPASVAPAPLLHPAARVSHRWLGVGAQGAILVDAGTGEVLWERRPHVRRPIASTTKIMTALLALDRLQPNQIVDVAVEATRAEPYREGLRPHQRIEAQKLLDSALLVSSNDSALALAIAAGGTRARFVRLMNEKAAALGLRDTHFRSPSGLIDVDNYSTPWDLAALTRYALRDPRFDAIVRTRVRRARWDAPTYAKVWVNHNKLLGTYPGADGVKTGWTTKAGHCLVASATRGDVRLIAVVLAAPDHYGDARRLLDFGFRLRGIRAS